MLADEGNTWRDGNYLLRDHRMLRIPLRSTSCGMLRILMNLGWNLLKFVVRKMKSLGSQPHKSGDHSSQEPGRNNSNFMLHCFRFRLDVRWSNIQPLLNRLHGPYFRTMDKTSVTTTKMMPNIPKKWNSLSLTLSSLSLPPLPLLNTRFITDSKHIAIWGPSANPALQCSNFSSAQDLQCQVFEDCTCQPAETKANCRCRDFPIGLWFNTLRHRLPMTFPSLTFLQQEKTVIARVSNMMDMGATLDEIYDEIKASEALDTSWMHHLIRTTCANISGEELARRTNRFLESASTSRDKILRLTQRYLLLDSTFLSLIKGSQLPAERREQWEKQKTKHDVNAESVMVTVDRNLTKLERNIEEMKYELAQINNVQKEEKVAHPVEHDQIRSSKAQMLNGSRKWCMNGDTTLQSGLRSHPL
ncbi:hypothetical protein OSTOST_25090 [Ostertagia ostertagi]